MTLSKRRFFLLDPRLEQRTVLSHEKKRRHNKICIIFIRETERILLDDMSHRLPCLLDCEFL